MDFEIDPLTGRMVPAGSMSEFAIRNRALRNSMDARMQRWQSQPASPRAYTGPGDGAPMFEDNPMVPPGQSAPPPEPPQPPPAFAMGGLAAGPPPFAEPPPNMSAMPMQPDPTLPLPPVPPGRALAQRPSPAAPQPVTAAPSAPPAQPQGALMAPPLPPSDEAFEQRLRGRESSDQPGIQNSGGFSGLYQFGAPRLAELGFYTPGQGEDLRSWSRNGGRERGGNQWTGGFRIPGFENVRTIQDFLANPDAQRAAYRAHIDDIDQAIDSTPGAEAFDRNGLRGVAHLGGVAGMRRYVETNGQYDPSDGNGTRLSAYYRTFAGSDAPPGAAGMVGRNAPAQPPSPPALTTPTPQPQDAAPANDPPGRGGFFGIPGEALMAAGAGMMGGRNMMDGFSRAGQAFVTQANAQRQLANQEGDLAARRADRREDRADRRVREDREARQRDEALAIQRARLAREGRTGAATPYTVGQTYRGEDGSLYVQRANRATGAMEWVNQRGEVVPPDAVPQRLTRIDQTGEGAANNAIARDSVQGVSAIVEEASAASSLRTNIANAREVLRASPNITGDSWRAQATRYVGRVLGIEIDGRDPADVAMIEQALREGQAQRIMQIAPSLRPMSNVDVQMIAQMVPNVLTNPRMIDAFLAQMDRAADRAERRASALAAEWQTREGRQRIAELGGVDVWRQLWDARETANRRGPENQPRPDVQRDTNQQGEPAWRPGERRQGPAGVVIERVN